MIARLAGIAAALLIVATSAACRSRQEPATAVVAPQQQIAPAGDTLRLAAGGSVTIAAGGPTIRFERVVRDSRCPAGVMCVWAGSVRVLLAVTHDPATAVTLELESNTTPRSAEVNGYQIMLLPEVEPAPGGSGSYAIRLTVTPPPR